MFLKRFRKKKEFDLLHAYHRMEEGVEDMLEEFPPWKKKRSFLRRVLKILFYCFLGLLVAVVFLGAFVFNDIWSIYNNSLSGKNKLEEAVDLSYSHRFHQAAVSASGAKQDLLTSYYGVEKWNNNVIISRFDFLQDRLIQFQHLLKTGVLLSQSLEKGGRIGGEIKNVFPGENLSFNSLSERKKRELLRIFYENSSIFKGIEGSLELAQLSLDRVRDEGMFFLLDNKIVRGQEKLEEGINTTKRILPLTELLPMLAGYPQKSDFLIALQNTNELRPAGGFLGTYGIAQTRNGMFETLETHDIYHMDMPVRDKMEVEPPSPIAEYLNKEWFMRDSNWSPDWPTSAQKIEWFYHKENSLLPPENKINDFSGEFEGVIGITPRLVTDLLSILGPVTVEGVEYDQHNFTRLLQYRVEKGYVERGIPSWHRKEVIGQILRKIKIKLFDLPVSQWDEIAGIIDDCVERKDVMLYFQDEYLQKIAKKMRIAGETVEAGQDYLMVVDANLGARKTDTVVMKNIDYQLEQDSEGLMVDLDINYSHTGEKGWRVSDYKTYTRVYVPSGSELISWDQKNNAARRKNEMKVKNKYGKTVFGTYLRIPVKENGSLQLKYRLPEKVAQQISEENGYGLYWQKQPGNNIEKIIVDVDLSNKVKSYHPAGFYAERHGPGNIRWSGELRRDRQFKIRFMSGND